jgi:hypothetical protein
LGGETTGPETGRTAVLPGRLLAQVAIWRVFTKGCGERIMSSAGVGVAGGVGVRKRHFGVVRIVAVMGSVFLAVVLIFAWWGADAREEKAGIEAQPGRAEATVARNDTLNGHPDYTVTFVDQQGTSHTVQGVDTERRLNVGDRFDVYYRLDRPDDADVIRDVSLGPPGSGIGTGIGGGGYLFLVLTGFFCVIGGAMAVRRRSHRGE